MTLREVVHAHIPVLYEDSTIRDAVDKMDIYQFPALVVVNSDHEPIAVVTEGDVARAVTMKGSLTAIAKDPAHVYGSKDPRTARADAEVSDALHMMLNSGTTLLPVTDRDRLAGVVLRVDLMQAMLQDSGV